MVLHLARRVLTPVRGCITVVVVCVAMIGLACSGTAVVRSGPAQADVSRTYPLALASVRTAIIDGFRRAGTEAPSRFTRMSIVELNTWPSEWAEGYADPGGYLAPYRRLPVSDRELDLLIEDPVGDQYWASEYRTSSGPVKFHCSFILHFMPAVPDGTKITVLEVTPVVWVGEKWGWSKEGLLPGWHHDIRLVEPTMKDRMGLLDWIDGVVRVP